MRPINVDKLTDEQLEAAVQKIANKINEEVDATCDKVNKLLSRYGMTCKMQIVIERSEATNKADERDKIEQDNV
jgi:hypothetical protein